MSIPMFISEIFSSLQGEGPYVGSRQIFVRFAGCNLCCPYCDTPAAQVSRPPHAAIECSPGKGEFFHVANPLTSDQVLAYIEHLLRLPHQAISFTGGEPLCQVEALAELASRLAVPRYLETNGVLTTPLLQILPYVDIISMDMKLPSSLGHAYWQEHEEFLRIAAAKEVFVKIVVTPAVTDQELFQAVNIITRVDPQIPLILQPVSLPKSQPGVAPDQLLVWQEKCLRKLTQVRVIPQVHKILHVL